MKIIKQLLVITTVLALLLCSNHVSAQKTVTKVSKGKNGQKTVVHKKKKKKNGKKVVVQKGKKGNTKVIRKGKNGKNYTYKRVKRTRVVHHHYRHLPKRGAIITQVHAKAVTVKFGGVGFRFHSGVWYKPHGVKWRIARPSYGIRIKVLPVGYRKIIIGPSTYYYYYGTYYINNANEYEVVEAPMGAEIGSLPDGYNIINIDGNEYYELDEIYYLPTLNEAGEEVLVVIKNPTL